MQISRRYFLGAGLALMAVPGRALADPAPQSSVKGAATVTAAQVQEMIDKGATGGERVLLIDGRRPGAFDKSHVAKAVKLNWRYSTVTQSWSYDTKALGGDKSVKIIVYGQNEADGFGALAAEKAVAEGYANVMWMRGGFAEWTAARLPTATS